jgi:hypothetical protein
VRRGTQVADGQSPSVRGRVRGAGEPYCGAVGRPIAGGRGARVAGRARALGASSASVCERGAGYTGRGGGAGAHGGVHCPAGAVVGGWSAPACALAWADGQRDGRRGGEAVSRSARCGSCGAARAITQAWLNAWEFVIPGAARSRRSSSVSPSASSASIYMKIRFPDFAPPSGPRRGALRRSQTPAIFGSGGGTLGTHGFRASPGDRFYVCDRHGTDDRVAVPIAPMQPRERHNRARAAKQTAGPSGAGPPGRRDDDPGDHGRRGR